MAILPALTGATSNDARLAWRDIATGLRSWRMWWTLGIGDVRQRYRRSRLGQFWITISMAVFIGGIGLLYAQLFRTPVGEYVPFLAVNMVVWTLISGIVSDSGTMFTAAENFLRHEALPKTIFAVRVLVRNLLNFAHNIVVIPIAFVLCGHPISWTWLLFPVGLAIVIAAGFFACLVIGILATRFRDLPQIITSALQIAFFLTPITWMPSALPERAGAIVDYNPFAVLLHVAALPLRGVAPSAGDYASALLVVALLALAALPLFARYRARIVYWL